MKGIGSGDSSIYSVLERVLLTEEEIQEKVSELGKRISRDFSSKNLLVLSVLKGSVVLLADIARAVEIPMQMGFVTISTYHGGTKSQGEPRIADKTVEDVRGKDVLVVEDILDTGKTLAFAERWLKEAGAASVAVCVLVAKEGYEKSEFPNPDYLGFVIPNVFVVGYGLDYQEKYRNLRCIGVLSRDVYARSD